MGYGYHSRRPSVPFVPTPYEVVREMLRMAEVREDDVVYDLGCGDGRIPLIAVREFGAKKAVCVEIREELAKQALETVRRYGLEGRVEVINADMFDVPLEDATVVTMFLLTSVNELLKPKLSRELSPGARVVSHEFQIPGWKPAKVSTMFDGRITHTLYLYVVGEHE